MFTDVWGMDAEAKEGDTREDKGRTYKFYDGHWALETGDAEVEATRIPPTESEPNGVFGAYGGGIGFYEAEEAANKIPYTNRSLSTDVFQAGEYSIGAMRKGNDIQYFTAARGDMLEYVIEINQLQSFIEHTENFARAANLVYWKGYLSESDKQILAGNMFTGIGKQWVEATQSPEWWVFAISSYLSLGISSDIPNNNQVQNSDLGSALKSTLDRIKAGTKFPHRNDGSIFTNKEGLLPIKPEGYYKEFVHPTPGSKGAGLQRIVTGRNGEIYYTPDHYKTFINIGG